MVKHLSDISDPSVLKSMTLSELNALAKEIRAFLIDNVSKTGGHLSSNLGVVELTLAMHYVFDSPKDHFIWDVSHQAYVHKILTGRQEGFKTLRQLGGLSGFTKKSESEHDKFDTGHSSTSISAGLGIALARDLNGDKFQVVSVIGDGALTGGMAFEALNHLGHTHTNMTVILNDNAMSIAPNVGGLSRALNHIRTNHKYRILKDQTRGKIGRIPGIGQGLVRSIRKVKDTFKYLLVNQGLFFEDLGLKYVGPVDGHDLKDLIEQFEVVKSMNQPVLIHVVTEKGKGFDQAEIDPDLYHGVGAFDPNQPLEKKVKNDYSALVGKTIADLADEDSDIVAISAAMVEGTGLSEFSNRHPNRIFDVGICEQHAVTLAAGLSTQGKKPFVAIYSTFLQRAYDQIIHDVCICQLNVVFCIDRAGVVGNDGETHHGIFDMAYLSAIPNMTILSPKDGNELVAMLRYAHKYQEGPIAIRYPRGNVESISNDVISSFEHEHLVKGKRVVLVATGRMVKNALEAQKTFGDAVGVINVRQIKPFNVEKMSALLETYETVITIEDHSVVGGLGDLTMKAIQLEKSKSKRLIKLGYPDAFVPQGDISELYKVYGLDASSIQDIVKEVLNG